MPTCYRHTGRETYIRCQRCDRPICPDCMREAAVGYQCVGCVAEGNRATRTGRTAYGGSRSANPAVSSLVLIGLNAAVWLLVVATGGAASRWVDRLALTPEGRCALTGQSGYYPDVAEQACRAAGAGVAWVDGVASGAWWQLLTSAFTHVQIWHIGFNMLALWFLGPQLEAVIGRVRFLALYLLSALSGSALVLWFAADSSSTIGASRAVFGLMGALLVVAHKVGGNYQVILGWLGINALITVVGAGYISWQGHLGGLIGGILLAGVLVYAPRPRRTAWQVAGMAVLAAVITAAVVARMVVS